MKIIIKRRILLEFRVGIVQKTFVYSNSLKNQYVISQRTDNKERELNVYINMKT